MGADLDKVSRDIAVKNFRQILFWPLVLLPPVRADGSDQSASEAVCDLACEIAKEPHWQAEPDLAGHISDGVGGGDIEGNPFSYAEIVYFHDFIQRSLFARNQQGQAWPCEDRPIHLLRRTDIKKLVCTVASRTFNLNIDRLNLYLFSSGVAIVVLELAAPHLKGKGGNVQDSGYSLADIQAFTDALRRWHVPFWQDDCTPGLMPEKIEWQQASASSPAEFDFAREGEMCRHISSLHKSAGRTPRPVAHWQHLLPKALPPERCGYQSGARHLHWRPFSDDRMATSTFITLSDSNDFGRIGDCDWFRLCYADRPGEGWEYKPKPVEDFERDNCFDWFYHYRTRQVFSGFSYAIVSTGDMADDTLVHHFRRHYFQMGLMVQFEKAALLAFSGKITRAVEQKKPGAGRDIVFENRILAIRAEFLHFVHRFRFTGVSSQMQPERMYEMWRAQMHLDELFKDVETELSASTDYIFATDQRDQTESAARLGAIATIGVVFGLLLSVAGLDIYKNFDNGAGRGWVFFSLVASIFCEVGILGMRLFVPAKIMTATTQTLELFLIRAAWAFTILFLMLMIPFGPPGLPQWLHLW